MKKAVLSGLTGLALLASSLAGCSQGELGRALTYSVGPSRPQVTYPQYIQDMDSMDIEDAKIHVKNNDHSKLKDVLEAMINKGRVEEAEKYAPVLYKMNKPMGYDIYQQLQKYRNEHPEEKK